MQTPVAPAVPIAAALSPILWQLNCPDRFDMYSMGILMLQVGPVSKVYSRLNQYAFIDRSLRFLLLQRMLLGLPDEKVR